MEFWKTQFDKLLISFFMLLFMGAIMFLVIRHSGADKAVDWAINAYSALSGALLGLITGLRMAQRKGDNGNGGNDATQTNGPGAPAPPAAPGGVQS